MRITSTGIHKTRITPDFGTQSTTKAVHTTIKAVHTLIKAVHSTHSTTKAVHTPVQPALWLSRCP